LFLEDDGYYWFLHPLFERLRGETEQYIDLYGDASFMDGALLALERSLVEARAVIESQPDAWEVHVGTQIIPTEKDLFKVAGSKIAGQWRKGKEVYKSVQ